MALCAIERRPEMLLGDCRRVRGMLQQDQFAFDTQELGQVPAFIARLATCERLIDGFEPQRDLTGLAKTNRQFAEQRGGNEAEISRRRLDRAHCAAPADRRQYCRVWRSPIR